jgi:processive 1,2-diacylglycerol beta-glucosyltransferase
MIRAVLLYTPAGGGHRAAATAIANELRAIPGAEVDVVDILDLAPRWFCYDKAWSLIQRRGAHAWDWLFDASDRGQIDLDAIRLPLHRALFREVDQFLLARRPTHVVCTHYLPAIAVARVNDKLRARTVVTITDHQPHRAWLVDGIDTICVADDATARIVRRRTSMDVRVTGIPIASAAGAPVRAIAPAIGRGRVLALLGGVPRAHAKAAIDSLAESRHVVHVLTGVDAAVAAHARARLPYAEIAERTDDMLGAIDAADVVVTKAGGLVTSECLARGRAMVMPFAAPGQERGNLFYALDAGAAIRPTEPSDTAAVVAELIAEPGRLRRMGARARAASRPDAARAVADALIETTRDEVVHAA